VIFNENILLAFLVEYKNLNVYKPFTTFFYKTLDKAIDLVYIINIHSIYFNVEEIDILFWG
jgi:hypothetical protein